MSDADAEVGAGSEGSEDSEDMAEAVAAAVLRTPGVHGLHPGVFGEVATYLPGRRVAGIRIGRDLCEVHVTLDWGAPVMATSDAVRDSVRPYVAGPVDVIVEDIADPVP